MKPAVRFYTAMFFPLRHWGGIEAQAVQNSLRQTLVEWGCPQHIRFDNGLPWGNPAIRVPTALALWLVGLGIQPIFGRLGQSTDNGVVERSHGVLAGWVEPQRCENQAELEQRLAYFVHIQREVYPLAVSQSRRDQFPALWRNPRRYRIEQEVRQWDLGRVLIYVADYTFTRLVEKNGRITVMGREYTLGRKYRSQHVTAQLDPLQTHWVVKDRYGEVIGQFPALQFSYPTIAGMTMTHRHFKAKLDGVSGEV